MGIDQVNTAMAQMDKVTQQNAANAEESASASGELSVQAESMKEVVGNLVALVGGAGLRRSRKGGPDGNRRQVHADPEAESAPRRAAGGHSRFAGGNRMDEKTADPAGQRKFVGVGSSRGRNPAGDLRQQ